MNNYVWVGCRYINRMLSISAGGISPDLDGKKAKVLVNNFITVKLCYCQCVAQILEKVKGFAEFGDRQNILLRI
jgi:hypothetical protein